MIVTNLVHDLTEMRSGLLRRLARARAGIRRTTPGPALVRGGVFIAVSSEVAAITTPSRRFLAFSLFSGSSVSFL